MRSSDFVCHIDVNWFVLVSKIDRLSMFVTCSSIQSNFKSLFTCAGGSLGSASFTRLSLSVSGFLLFFIDFLPIGNEEPKKLVVFIFPALGFLEKSVF